MSAIDLATVVGAVAAILAIWSGLLRAARWYRQKRTCSALKQVLIELYGLDRELCDVAVEADYRLAGGLGWKGWELWPDSLTPILERLWGLTSKLDGMRARARAQWTEGSIERLRDDIEQLVLSLRRATDLYTKGAIEAYRENQGEPLKWSASGRAPTHTLYDTEAREKVEELKQTPRLLFRSSAYQLNLKDMVERDDVALWPILERDSFSLRKK